MINRKLNEITVRFYTLRFSCFQLSTTRSSFSPSCLCFSVCELFRPTCWLFLFLFLFLSAVQSLRSGRLIGLFPRFRASPRRPPSHPSPPLSILGGNISGINGIWGNFSPRHSPSPPSSLFTSARADFATRSAISFFLLWHQRLKVYCTVQADIINISNIIIY